MVRWSVLGFLLGIAIVLPHLVFGTRLEAAAVAALRLAAAWPWFSAALVVLLLAGDAVLPIPSSLVGAFAGATLGWSAGGAVVWAGLMLGCVIGYWIGRVGSRAAVRVVGDDEVDRSKRLFDTAGPVVLAATRSIPVLAEACILAAGICRMRFGQFVVVTAIANVPVALAYALIGEMMVSFDATLAAIALTLAPAAIWCLWFLARRYSPVH